AIEKDPSLTEPLIENTGIRRCEIEYLVENELVVKLEDYLRRRSKVELLVTRDKLRNSSGLYEACERLFGDQARARYDEYFAEVAD
ncbi:MAG: FAD-dependent oxidoreductase, partial [Gammaproteobacteria bacterium]|nr:FAD-dependent oxidoreductase [Gammaproteobacteria bacterium]